MSSSTIIVTILTLIGRVLALFKARQSSIEKDTLREFSKKSDELSMLKRAVVARKNAQQNNHENISTTDLGSTGIMPNDKYQRTERESK